MSKKSTKGRLSFDDNDSSIIDENLPGPSKPTTSYPLNDDELLRLLQDSDFEENFSDESEDDNDYIVEQDNEVPLQSPTHTTKNISTASSSHDLPTGSPSIVIQPQNQQVWTPTRKNAPLLPFDGPTGMLQVPTSDEPIDFFYTYSRTIFSI